jgi:hypothetical protein
LKGGYYGTELMGIRKMVFRQSGYNSKQKEMV